MHQRAGPTVQTSEHKLERVVLRAAVCNVGRDKVEIADGCFRKVRGPPALADSPALKLGLEAELAREGLGTSRVDGSKFGLYRKEIKKG